MSKSIPLAILAGCAIIAAAIYVKPSEYDRCVDRYTSTFMSLGNVSEDRERVLTLAATKECVP